MGYEIHITRKEIWHEENHNKDIPLGEWLRYVSGDNEMILADPDNPQSGDALWRREPKTEIVNYFSYNHGNGDITVKNPDNEVIWKMINISTSLKAKVQGDEEECYDESYFDRIKKPAKKQWWKFWN